MAGEEVGGVAVEGQWSATGVVSRGLLLHSSPLGGQSSTLNHLLIPTAKFSVKGNIYPLHTRSVLMFSPVCTKSSLCKSSSLCYFRLSPEAALSPSMRPHSRDGSQTRPAGKTASAADYLYSNQHAGYYWFVWL